MSILKTFDDLMNSKYNNDQRETFIPQKPEKSRIVNHQPSQNTMTNQSNPSCWEALQNLRDLSAGAPFVDCLFDLDERLLDLRKQITEKNEDIEPVKSDKSRAEEIRDIICEFDELFDTGLNIRNVIDCLLGDDPDWQQDYQEMFTGKIERVVRNLQEINTEMQRERVAEKDCDSANNQLIKMIERPEHTIVIDGITYYSAKHHKPKHCEVVTGFAKEDDYGWLNYCCPNPTMPGSVARPAPLAVWYDHKRLCWYIYEYSRKCDYKINVIVWTHLPHPKSIEELQDFGNSL